MDLVWPIDQDTAGLVCSSEPVFGFVLGGDPDRLARVKGEAREPTGPGAAAGITSSASFSLRWPDFPQPLFNQSLRLAHLV